jgi:hypothetical protein
MNNKDLITYEAQMAWLNFALRDATDVQDELSRWMILQSISAIHNDAYADILVTMKLHRVFITKIASA